MAQVTLSYEEWQRVVACMLCAPGRDCNPLINKISAQIEHQQVIGNSKEMPAAQAHLETSTKQ